MVHTILVFLETGLARDKIIIIIMIIIITLLRADRRRMVELREDTGVQKSLTERLVRSRLQWAGHV